ncbi:MAG: family 43 glycosylhydrolase [Odoribacter sp.]|nr:family 43 glycosylhydrolase [Odoribacter sp.]
MKRKLFITLFLSTLFLYSSLSAQNKRYEAIHSGINWFDQNNNEVNAHGACIVKEGKRYYLFGEFHTDTSNAFVGFSCYSSLDLINWKFENIVLPMQADGLLGPNRVGERVKVMKCPSTGEYVMYMHTDDLKYSDPHIGYATCKTINGDYEFQGELLHDGNYLRKWDLGTFQDSDGKGYLLTHEGFIYELAEDYKSVHRIVISHAVSGGESPAMFKSNGYYFWLFSNKTSWERNDNYYLTATSLDGPWTKQGLFAPRGSLTWNSQCSFVLPIITKEDTLNLYMGDRWSYPKQGSAATYVWLPILVDKDKMAIPVFCENWNFNKSDNQWFPISLKTENITEKYIQQGFWETQGNKLKSNQKGASLSWTFKGKQIGIKGLSNNVSGYAKVTIKNSKDQVIINSVIDFYTKNEVSSQKFLSPLLKMIIILSQLK